MPSRSVEFLVGLFFALGVAAVFIMTFRVASLDTGRAADSYTVHAYFDNIGGLKSGAAVTLSGVRVGRVRAITIDPDTFSARVDMSISKGFDNLPRDTGARILTAGLLGEQYIGLDPGGDIDALADGDRIRLTQDALVLENLIGQLLSSMTNRD